MFNSIRYWLADLLIWLAMKAEGLETATDPREDILTEITGEFYDMLDRLPTVTLENIQNGMLLLTLEANLYEDEELDFLRAGAAAARGGSNHEGYLNPEGC